MSCLYLVTLLLVVLSSTSFSSSTVILQEGEEALLQCPYSDGDIGWYKLYSNDYSGINDTTSDDIMIFNDDSSLAVNESGSYVCSVSNAEEKILYSCPTVVKSAEISDEFIVNPSDTTVHRGYTAVMECIPPSSFPSPPLIYWTKDDIPLNLSSSHYFLSPTLSGNLYIYSTVDSDSGLYKCVAVNRLTLEERVSIGGYLTIGNHWNLLYPPKYILSPRDVTLLKGSSHQLECLLNTLERVNHWERIGHSSLPPSANSSINTSLVFTSIGESDGGRYRCVYTPAFGDPLYSEAIIKVVAFPKAHLTVNSSNIITCSTASLSLPVNLTLLVGGVIIYSSTHHTQSYSFNLSTVPYRGREIWVQCIMINTYGCDQDTLKINIEDTGEVTNSISPTVTSLLLSSTATPTLMTTPIPLTTPTITISNPSNGVLYCNVTLVTPMGGSIVWKSGTTSLSGATEVVSSPLYVVSQLIVTTPGYYYCIWLSNYMISPLLYVNPPLPSPPAETPSPTQSPSPSLPPLTVSVPVTSLLAYEGQHVNVTCIFNQAQLNNVSWTRQDNGRHQNIHSNYIIQFTANSTVVILPLGPLSIEDSSIYQCVGSDSSGSMVVMGKGISLNVMIRAPSYPPLSLQAEWVPSINLLILTWLPPLSNNSRILGYKLNWGIYSDNNGRLSLSARAAVPSTVLFFSLRDVLIVGERYSFSVWAYTIGGDGPPTVINKFLPASQLPSPTPVAATVTNTISLATPTPSSNVLLPLVTKCHALTPTLGRVEIKGIPNAVRYSINYQCSSGRHGNMSISLFAPSIVVPIYHLKPGSQCNVTSSVYSSDEIMLGYDTCNMTTPTDNDNSNHVNVSVHWRDDGMLIMNWSLSEWLSLLGIVRVEWRLTTPFSSQWNVINNDGIINNYKGDIDIKIRVKLNSNIIYLSTLSPPPSPSIGTITPYPSLNTTSSGYHGNVWLTYGVGIVLLVSVCVFALMIIMALKLIQKTRREKNKVIDRKVSSKSSLKHSPSCNSNKTLSDISSTDLKRVSSLSSPLSIDTPSTSGIRIIRVRRIDTDV